MLRSSGTDLHQIAMFGRYDGATKTCGPVFCVDGIYLYAAGYRLCRGSPYPREKLGRSGIIVEGR